MEDSQTLSKAEQERQVRMAGVKKRRFKKFVMWLLVLLGIAAGIYGLIYFVKQAEKSKPGQEIPAMGANHIAVGAEHEPYNSNPPTSGPHYAQPANWGIYDEPLPDEKLVHNLEHGGIWISYRDKDNVELVKQLKDITDDYSVKVILTYRPQNDAPIAVAAWGRLLKLETFDRKQILDFLKAFINKGPEQVPY